MVKKLMTVIVRNAAGTVATAGRDNSCPTGPAPAHPVMLIVTAAADVSPPTRIPAIAPASVKPRHQMPSTSSGQNVEAATANTSGTDSARSSLVTVSERVQGLRHRPARHTIGSRALGDR